MQGSAKNELRSLSEAQAARRRLHCRRMARAIQSVFDQDSQHVCGRDRRRSTWRATVEFLTRLGRIAADRHPDLKLMFGRERYAVARRALAAGSHRAGMEAFH